MMETWSVKNSAKQLLLKDLKKSSKISTSIKSLDVLLGGGIENGYVTEIAGESGSGKTQFCFQLAINTQLPNVHGGLNGEVIFIDTENTFSSDRLIEMININLQNLALSGKYNELASRSLEDFLSKIYVFRCIEAVELLAVVHQLTQFIDSHPKVRLVIIDSVANAVRSEELTTRTRIMLDMVTKLRKIAAKQDIAVIVINQATTRFNNDRTSCVIPALGECWSYVPAVKIMLRNQLNTNKKIAFLTKSPTKPPGTITYIITSAGVRDVTSSEVLTKKKGVNLSAGLKNKSSQNAMHQKISSEFILSSQKLINKNDVTSVPIQGYDNGVKFLKRPGSSLSVEEEPVIKK